MDRSSPSFFQVLINPHFTRSLRVPTAFGQKHEEILSTGKAKLKISSGETWEVKVEKMEDGYHFTEGWEKFAQDLGLEKSDLLVFFFTGQSIFDVYGYGRDGYRKEYSLASPSYVLIEDSPNDDDDDDEVERIDVADNSNPKFEILLKNLHASRVYILTHFAEAAGLFGKTKVTLEYRPSGFRSEVALEFRSNNMKRRNTPHYMVELANGWRAFRVANGLRHGNTYSLEFVPSKGIIEVTPIDGN